MGTHPIFESDFDCLTEKLKNAAQDKMLDRDEFKVALKALGHQITKEKFTKIFKQPGDQLASWDDYFELAKEIVLSRNPREETEKAFNLMSEDGKIGPRELRKAFKQLGETVSEDG